VTPPIVDELRDWLAPYLRASLPGNSDLDAAARYAMGWVDAEGQPGDGGGKRLRPVLCLAVAEACGGARDEALAAAVAIELIHNFSLVHDDVQDDDEQRHGRPTVWRIYGTAQAINVGDYLATTAFRILGESALPPERITRQLTRLGAAVAEMVSGQWSDLALEAWNDASVDDYVAMVSGKTGALLGASAALGAVAAGATEARIESADRWARTLGLAFQAHDDYLGLWGDPAETGKSASSDLERGKKSLPLVLAAAQPELQSAISAAMSREGEPDVEAVRTLLEQAGIREEVRHRAAKWQSEADHLLAQMDLSDEHHAMLTAFSLFVINREY
jgi:geranylgeranyl diphosphate synthase type I